MYFIVPFVRIVLLFAVAAYAAPIRGMGTLRAGQAAVRFKSTLTKGDVVHVKPKDAVPKLDKNTLRHPGIITHDVHQGKGVQVAIVSKNNPHHPNTDVSTLVPSAGLVGNIYTGQPPIWDPSKVTPDNLGRKASVPDLAKLNAEQAKNGVK